LYGVECLFTIEMPDKKAIDCFLSLLYRMNQDYAHLQEEDFTRWYKKSCPGNILSGTTSGYKSLFNNDLLNGGLLT